MLPYKHALAFRVPTLTQIRAGMEAMWNPSIRNRDRENFMAGWLARLSGISGVCIQQETLPQPLRKA